MTEESSNEVRTNIPPLPPPLPKKVEAKKKPTDNVIPNFLPNEEGLTWASSHLELQRACYFANVAIKGAPNECRFKEFQGILQEGPTCGFVALSMLFNEKITAKELLEQGLSHNFTKNGEMFSVVNLLTILRLNQQHFHPETETVLYDGPLDAEKIKTELKSGSILLVAYDADVNHSPALLNGHKAHWALVVGYLITKEEQFYVLARHGKSKYFALWSLKALSESNSGLLEFAKPKKYESQEFLLPKGGIADGLREKCIVIRGVDNKDFIL